MKLKIWTLSIVGLVLLTMMGCKKDEEGSLRIVFKGSFGNDPLVMFETHDYAGGQRIQFSRSEFFLSDLNLIDDSGNSYPLSEIELIDLSFTSQAGAEEGIVLTFNDISAGDYSDLEFGFGVASDINATEPVNYPSSSPLSNTGRYWVAWNSFIFSKTEGNLDTLIDGTDNLDMGFAYHTGSDDLYRVLNLNTTVPIHDGTTTSITFDLDYEKLFGLPGDPLDIKESPQNHSPSDVAHIQALVDNLVSSLTYFIE